MMCAALFSAESSHMLKIVSMICVGKGLVNFGSQLCGSHNDAPGAINHSIETDAAPVVAQCLRAFVSQCPRLELATVLDVKPTISNKPHATPFINVWALGDGNALLRARNREEMIAECATIQKLAKGQVWKKMGDGLRLPALLA
jgi:hypothetical protein